MNQKMGLLSGPILKLKRWCLAFFSGKKKGEERKKEKQRKKIPRNPCSPTIGKIKSQKSFWKVPSSTHNAIQKGVWKLASKSPVQGPQSINSLLERENELNKAKRLIQPHMLSYGGLSARAIEWGLSHFCFSQFFFLVSFNQTFWPVWDKWPSSILL